MVQVAESVVVKEVRLRGNEAGAYLEGVVNAAARDGWEFFRVDEMAMSVQYDTFMGIQIGIKVQSTPSRFYVVTFRRPPLPSAASAAA
jgi:hypothetical protein